MTESLLLVSRVLEEFPPATLTSVLICFLRGEMNFQKPFSVFLVIGAYFPLRSDEVPATFLLPPGHFHICTYEVLAKTILLSEDIELFAF